ncbi:MAG: nitronate monooxygenase, partial [Acidobacteria bacterium]|nr:nitronate monooxygenase [Acidobacteriota bacterium]
MLQNRVCSLLGIKYPILQGGMTWISEPILASSFSNAGGLGTLAAGNMTPDLLLQDIVKIRTLTDKPFAVNLILLSPHFKECLNMVI